jgi:DNA-binding FrmR family transcriptional regulator
MVNSIKRKKMLTGVNFLLTNREGDITIKLYTIGGYSMEREKKDILLRLRRIEGQLRGLQRMVEEGLPCADILTQVAAVTAAIKRVGMVVVKTHMEECLDKTQKEPVPKRKDTLRDFQIAVSRYIDWA